MGTSAPGVAFMQQRAQRRSSDPVGSSAYNRIMQGLAPVPLMHLRQAGIVPRCLRFEAVSYCEERE